MPSTPCRSVLLRLVCATTCLAILAPAGKARGTDPQARIEALLGQMTLEEEAGLCHGDSYWTVAGAPRLGVPKLHLSDGPHGVHEERLANGWASAGRTDDYVTDLPVGVALACTWNTVLARSYGEVLGAEARARGKDVILGPGVNIARTPLFGRNFEFFGEDPRLAARIAVDYIRGVQSEGVAACVKHFAAYNQEWGARGGVDVEVGRRALHEIYLPAFRAAVKEGRVLAVMAAYNRVDGSYCCENEYLLNTVLKGKWGFDGVVLSDWGAAHSTLGCARHGLDLEMSGWAGGDYGGMYFGRPLLSAVRRGAVPRAVVDDKARRVLRLMFRLGMIGADRPRPAGSLNTPEHQAVALRVAEESIVLLKNDGDLLPLDPSRPETIAVIGANAVCRHSPVGQGGGPGGGSSAVKPLFEITPLEGLLSAFGRRDTIVTAAGYGDDRAQAASLRAAAVKAARAADVVIYVGGLSHDQETETKDRSDMELPDGQDALIRAVAAANPRTIVVLIGGSAMDMRSWVDRVPSVLFMGYGGSEGGAALADVLAGGVDPSGHLPVTFGARLEDYAPHAVPGPARYPGANGEVRYDEGVFVGYRHFDAAHIAPLFCFGYGLSYTSFRFRNLSLSPAAGPGPFAATFEIENTGRAAGAEVAQLYVEPVNPRVPRPVRELKGFRKISLLPGGKAEVSLPLERRDFAFYDAARQRWAADPGAYLVEVGGSSRDLPLRAKIMLK